MLTQTPSQTVGPFFFDALIRNSGNNLVNEHTQGQRITLIGRVLDGDGQPVPDAMIEIWQADAQGIFAHPADPRYLQADPHFRGFGRSDTTHAGQFCFTTTKPGSISAPGAQAQAPHINIRVFARGMLTHAITRCYFADEAINQHDPILNMIEDARRHTLIASLKQTHPLPTYHFDIILQGESETVFFQP